MPASGKVRGRSDDLSRFNGSAAASLTQLAFSIATYRKAWGLDLSRTKGVPIARMARQWPSLRASR